MSEAQGGHLLGREDFGDVTVLRVTVPMLRGDETTEALFEEASSVVEDGGRHRLVLNFDGVGYLASMALGKLVMLGRKARLAGGRLTLCRVPHQIQEVLHTTHLADVLLIYGGEQEAVRSFS